MLFDRSHFRKASTGRQSVEFYKRCCYCRNASPVPLATPSSQHGEIKCNTCGEILSTPHFRGARGRPVRTCVACRDGDTGVLTPRSARSQPRRRLNPSSSSDPDSPPTSPTPTRARRALSNNQRPQRHRQPPRRPDQSPPHPAVPPPPPRRRVNLHIGQKRCNLCKCWKSAAEYHDGKLGCAQCLARRREYYHRRQPPPLPSTTLPTQSSYPQPPISPILGEQDTLTISDEAKTLIDNFYAALDEETLEECSICKERWFGLGVIEGVCCRCRKDPHRWGASNCLDPGPSLQKICSARGLAIPETPTSVEEMLLSRVHVQLQTWKVNGNQRKYSGHTCLFSRDNDSLFTRLPLLPSQLDVLVIKPKQTTANSQDTFASRPEFQVQRARVLANLLALKAVHPSYRDIIVDDNALAALPESGSVFDQLRSTTLEDEMELELPPDALDVEGTAGDDSEENSGVVSEGMVPVVDRIRTEVEQIREGLGLVGGDEGEPSTLQAQTSISVTNNVDSIFLTAPPVGCSPLNEHDRSRFLLIEAFPFLFPTGKADLHAPRPQDIKPGEYFRHLLRYSDGRFAGHNRFRYYAFNCLLRWQARSLSTFYISRNKEDAEFDAAAIQELSRDDAKTLAKRVRRYAATLTGTPPYWAARSRELQAMIRQLGTPHAFITHSAADLQWPDLHRHMPSQPSLDATEQQRQKVNRQNVNDNPALAAWWFYRRWSLFFRTVLQPLLGVKDWWYRFEWQHRGSSHVHGLIWLSKAPDIGLLNPADPTTVEDFLCFWKKHVTAVNPNPDHPPATIHPSSLSAHQLSFKHSDLAQLLNRVQRHTRCSTYCLRRPKGSPPGTALVCRFKYPKALQNEDELVYGQSGTVNFNLKRNDPLLNPYHPVLAQAWRANTDFSPCTDGKAVATYIAKYASKTEPRSAALGDVLQGVSAHLEEDAPGRVVYQKLLSKIVTERDYSAQEVCHALLDCHMYGASREFKSLSLLEQQDWHVHMVGEEEEPTAEKDWREKYKSRPEDLEAVCLYDWFLWYWQKRDRTFGKRRQERIVQLWPAYHPGPEGSSEYEEWCRAKVLLHHAFRQESDLRQDLESWSGSYAKCQEDHPDGHKDTLPRRAAGQPTSQSTDSEFSEDISDDERELEDFEIMCLEGGGRDNEHEVITRLGRRDMDLQKDWLIHGRIWGDKGMSQRMTYIQEEQKKVRGLHHILRPPISLACLNPSQDLVLQKIIRHATLSLTGNSLPPVLLNIDGTAGTGKSFLIDAISQELTRLQHWYLPALPEESLIRRIAPTGVAAFNIGGQTYHSALSLAADTKNFSSDISSTRLASLQEGWKDVRYMILDEKSMIGRMALGRIDERLRLIFPGQSHLPFGGLSVLLVGDFGQLPPVGDTPLYVTGWRPGRSRRIDLSNMGRNGYLAFKESITLSEVMRQAGSDPTSLAFKQTLANLRACEPSAADYDLLSTRFWHCLSTEEQNTFGKSTYLCTKKDTVEEINLNSLLQARQPVLRISARNTGPGSRDASEDQAEGLPKTLFLMEGAKVMITRNVWTKQGLTNGTTGTIAAIGFAPGSEPGTDVPTVVMVEVPLYTGPTEWHSPTGVPLVPIVPITSTWESSNGQRCTRQQLPLRLAFALTIHKSQGMTLERVCIDLGTREFSRGLTFVGISRVKTLSGLAFRPGFSMTRLEGITGRRRGRRDGMLDAAKEDEVRRQNMGNMEVTSSPNPSQVSLITPADPSPR
ncbi:hypothetical protein M231_01519 [Tremella mesenterica]|uniref:ATP-dependent DNA helicase n=1 Tax=Tremella mesenterica TaxID=5217 RepID=A0A4Q1BT00_TREME|nr:hypothetical protein M231_01519 [Tremella mesenterica]